MHSAEIDPALSNGSADLTLRATADTTLTGSGSAVQAVKYSLTPVVNANMATTGTIIDLTGDGDNPARQAVEATIPAS